MKKIPAIFWLVLLVTSVTAQNLVFNGSFEMYKTCPKYPSQITLATGWFTPSYGTPDYFNKCCGKSQIGVPGNFIGYQQPRTGSAYVGIYLYQSGGADSYREYISTELKSPLERSKQYIVKFYVCLANLSECAVANIGVLFSPEIKKTGTSDRITSKPQLNYMGDVITDTLNWIEISWTYKAKGNEKYMTIGNFTKAEKCSIKYLITNLAKGISLNSYYYIDDICVEEIRDSTPCKCEQDSNVFKIRAGKMIIIKDSVKTPKLNIEPEQTTILANIFFETDKSELLPASYKELNQLVQYLKKNRAATIAFSGYTDNTGRENKNLSLSLNRAKAVADYMIQNGIAENRITYKGYGSANPIGDNTTTEGKSKNRRVEFKIHLN